MSAVAQLSEEMSHLWAKDERSPRYQLLQHLIDVCQQTRDYYVLYQPRWPRGGGVDLPRVLAYASLLHDFGKIHVGFQSMLRGQGSFRNRHEILSLAFLDWLRIPEYEFGWLAASIASHHRGLFKLLQKYAIAGPGTFVSHLAEGVPISDAALLHLVLSNAHEIFQEARWPHFAPYELVGSELDVTAAILRSMHKIGAFGAEFEPTPQFRPGPPKPPDWRSFCAAVHTRGWLINADHLASFGKRPIHQSITSVHVVENLLRTAIEARVPYRPSSGWNSHQREARDTSGSGLLTAPTGSGKTEAALLWAAAQAEKGGLHGRLYMVLPYQASMNAMQKRLVEDLFPDNVDAETWNSYVALAHGRAVRRAFESLLDSGHTALEAADRARTQADLARLNAAPVVVCSPFALIRTLFATKGAEALHASFFEARIVLDEIHAYDVPVTSMTMATLRFLTNELGARVLMMSATIPDHLRRSINSLLPGITQIHAVNALDKIPRHRLQLLAFHALSPAAEQCIRERAVRGSVLVVVNRVKRARLLYEKLRSEGLDVVLLHGRFNYKDRMRHEKELQPKPGRVLVSTQAVEVSLDVDYDVCLSENAPMESLLQRFGRCNRYGLRSPSDVFVFRDFPESDNKPWNPYDETHLRCVLHALTWHSANANGDLPECAVPELIERSYAPSKKSELALAIPERCQEITNALIHAFRPFGLRDARELEQLEEAWQELFDGLEVMPSCCLEEARAEESWLARARYLVPVSGSALRRIKRDWDKNLRCFVTEVPYDKKLGLLI